MFLKQQQLSQQQFRQGQGTLYPSFLPIFSRLYLKIGWVALTAKGNQLNPLTTLIRKGYYESFTLEPGGTMTCLGSSSEGGPIYKTV